MTSFCSCYYCRQAKAKSEQGKGLRDQDYIRWLEDGLVTLGTSLRKEIAARLRELTQ